ncbi:uracil-DNA glycosylase family protein [Chloroflexota bacterium]
MFTEDNRLDSYNFGYPASCTLCSEIWHGYLITPRLEAKPYVGSSPKIFLIGQDPTLTNRNSTTVFELDRENSPLHKYIEKEILAPLGFTIDDIYATNAVKCTFPNRTPAQWAKMMKIPPENFLRPFFRKCRKYLTREIVRLKPRIIIAFGQPTHRLLLSAYKWKIKPDMKEVFGHAFPVHTPISTLYVPAIHYNSRKHRFYQEHWAGFIQVIQGQIGADPQQRVRLSWLKRLPRRVESISAAIGEIKEAVETLKADREEMLMDEKSKDYPHEERVERYDDEILRLENILTYLNKILTESIRK